MQNIKNRLLNSSTQEVPKVSKADIVKAFKDVGVIPSHTLSWKQIFILIIESL